MTAKPSTSPARSAMDVDAIVAADRAHLLHPYAPILRGEDAGPLLCSAQGVRVRDVRGREYLDACSGLLNVNLGYGREDLVRVAAESMRELSYANLFFGRGSVPSAALAAKLAEVTPPGLTRFFPTLGGSDAADTVIKVARYYHSATGRPEKHHVIGRHLSYHGMTMGATSLTGDVDLWEHFGERLPGFSFVRQPDDDVEGSVRAVEEEILRVGADRVAAFVAEPVSMSPGMVLPPDGYWQGVREVCTRHDVLLALDETITGCGRTGRMFAAEHWGVAPDMMISSKGITSGYMPLGVVGVTEQIAEGLVAGGRDFMHGFTAGGHPVACSVALETLAIIEREGLVERSATVGAALLEQLGALAERHPTVLRARGLGLLTAIDVDTAAIGPGARERIVGSLLEHGLLVRDYVGAATLCIGPPLTVTDEELSEIVSRLDVALTAVESGRSRR